MPPRFLHGIEKMALQGMSGYKIPPLLSESDLESLAGNAFNAVTAAEMLLGALAFI